MISERRLAAIAERDRKCRSRPKGVFLDRRDLLALVNAQSNMLADVARGGEAAAGAREERAAIVEMIHRFVADLPKHHPALPDLAYNFGAFAALVMRRGGPTPADYPDPGAARQEALRLRKAL